ncbi:MAG: response regulator [Albidovulum sp.]
MNDDLTEFFVARGPLPGRPLTGLTVLVVEDSRFACEAMRALCLRSGARIRRADCLRSARRHLQTYRPTIVIVDLGLPDGSGLELIAEMSEKSLRAPVMLATSGDPDLAQAALAAGADGFLAKPIESLAAFQTTVLAALPACDTKLARSCDLGDQITPDPIALRDDLAHAARLLDDGPDDGALDYIAQFLSGVAASAHDRPLADAARDLARDHGVSVHRVSDLVQDRLATGAAF